ncbi:phosphate-starvation-inducible PsiE family protein, partial [Gammaproteobacteria bacterium]|nr:phosphate-starvation-inducible PsiE family protein [Gammaproteobacteria bacterium]
LPDLFMLFIYAEIIGMVGAFYSTNRIPVTLPIIIAITALCRLIIMHSKEMDALVVLGEAGAILILSGAAGIVRISENNIDASKSNLSIGCNASSAQVRGSLHMSRKFL